jgi:hypothetical protein
MNTPKPLRGPRPMAVRTVHPPHTVDFSTWAASLKVSKQAPMKRNPEPRTR